MRPMFLQPVIQPSSVTEPAHDYGLQLFGQDCGSYREHDKIGTAEPYKICPIDVLDTIVTETDAGDQIFAPYRNREICIL